MIPHHTHTAHTNLRLHTFFIRNFRRGLDLRVSSEMRLFSPDCVIDREKNGHRGRSEGKSGK